MEKERGGPAAIFSIVAKIVTQSFKQKFVGLLQMGVQQMRGLKGLLPPFLEARSEGVRNIARAVHLQDIFFVVFFLSNFADQLWWNGLREARGTEFHET